MSVFKQHLHYFRNLIAKQSIQLLPEKVVAITNLKEINSMDGLCHFLGLTDYYRRLVPLITNITKPINKLLKRALNFNGQLSVSQLLKILKSSFC